MECLSNLKGGAGNPRNYLIECFSIGGNAQKEEKTHIPMPMTILFQIVFKEKKRNEYT
jgi:hypothetical protein